MNPNDEWANATEAGSGSGSVWDGATVLIGTYVKMKTNVGPNGSNMYDIRTDDGETVSVWGSAVIDNKFDEVPLKSRVRLEFLGTKKNPKTNREFKDYKLLFKEPAPEDDWAAGAKVAADRAEGQGA